MTDLVIIDAGGANLGSVRAAFARLGVAPELSRDPARIATAGRLVLPGVGAAAPVMDTLRASGIDVLLRGLKTPLLGVCIGMQVLFERSEEGVSSAIKSQMACTAFKSSAVISVSMSRTSCC